MTFPPSVRRVPAHPRSRRCLRRIQQCPNGQLFRPRSGLIICLTPNRSRLNDWRLAPTTTRGPESQTRRLESEIYKKKKSKGGKMRRERTRHLKQEDRIEKNETMADKPAGIIDRTLVLIHVLLVRSGKVGMVEVINLNLNYTTEILTCRYQDYQE